jgi:hypothetical protein
MPPSRGKKRGLAVGPTKRGKGTKIIALADFHVVYMSRRLPFPNRFGPSPHLRRPGFCSYC